MLIYGWDPGKAAAGWEWRWRGAASEDVGRLLPVWSAYAQAGALRSVAQPSCRGAGSSPPPDCLSASTQTGYWNAQAIFSRLCQ